MAFEIKGQLYCSALWDRVSRVCVCVYLSGRPYTVHMLSAQPALGGQEVQDNLALFNDLQRKTTNKNLCSVITQK